MLCLPGIHSPIKKSDKGNRHAFKVDYCTVAIMNNVIALISVKSKKYLMPSLSMHFCKYEPINNS